MDTNLLWTKLAIEDDILIGIFKHLDPVSLRNIEETCNQFRTFINRTHMWKRLCHQNNPRFLENKDNSDILKRMNDIMNWDEHYKFKKLCLKVYSLECNWTEKNWKQKSLNLQQTFKAHIIKVIETSLILSVTSNPFFSSLGTVFDLTKWRKEDPMKMQEAVKMHILSAHISESHLVFFGEPKYGDMMHTSNGDIMFCIKLFSNPGLDFVKRSKGLGPLVATQRSKVKVSGQWVVLFQSHFKEDTTGPAHDSIHLFSWTDASQHLVHCKKFALDHPARRFLTLISFDHLYVSGIRKPGTVVEMWHLGSESSDTVPVTWRKDVGNRNTASCTALALVHPLVYVGKTNGRCEVWDVEQDLRVMSLDHEPNGDSGLLAVQRIVVLSRRIITLTNRGRIHVWSKQVGEGRIQGSRTSSSCLLWTHKIQEAGIIITDVFADSTKMVWVETNTKTHERTLHVADFWTQGQQNRQITRTEDMGSLKRKQERRDLKKRKKCCSFC